MNNDNSNHLPVGFKLDDFSIVSVAGEGGFSVVYLAEDTILGRTVAIKEYLPTSVAARGRDLITVLPRSDNTVAGFQAGLRSFIREARLLAQFSHPAIVEVYRVWEQHGTAYIAMRYLKGETLSHHIRHGRVFSEDDLRIVLEPIFDAIELLHSQSIIHRDVSPDNIILADGKPVLLDLGAARVVVGGLTQALTSVLKPGYAPIEQYADDGSLKQGTWTDVYAIAGVLYKLASGITPVQAIGRVVGDPLQSLQKLGGNFSETFAESVMAGLTVFPEHRIKTVGELRERLGWHEVSTQLVTTTVRTVRNQQIVEIASRAASPQGVHPAEPPLERVTLDSPSATDDEERTVVTSGASYRDMLLPQPSFSSDTGATEHPTFAQDDDRTVVTRGVLANLRNRAPPADYAPDAFALDGTTRSSSVPLANADRDHEMGARPPADPATTSGGYAQAGSGIVTQSLVRHDQPLVAKPASRVEREPPTSAVITRRWWVAACSSLALLAVFVGYRVWFSAPISAASKSPASSSPAATVAPAGEPAPVVVAQPAPPSLAPPSPPLSKSVVAPPAVATKDVVPPQQIKPAPTQPMPNPQSGTNAARPAVPSVPNKTSPQTDRTTAQRSTANLLPASPVASTASSEPRRAAPSFNGTWLGDIDCPASTGPDARAATAFKRRVTAVVAGGELVITREGSVREEFSGVVRADGRIALAGTGYRVSDPTYRWKATGNARADATRDPLRIDGSIKLEKADAWTSVCTVQLTKE